MLLQKSVINRVLMQFDDKLLSMPEDEIRKRLILRSDEECDRLTEILKKELSKIRQEGISDTDLYNAYSVYFNGVGVIDKCFSLNEWLGDDESILDFETLDHYSKNYFVFQEKAKIEEYEDYEPLGDYALYLNHCWARVVDGDNFHYLTLTSYASLICDDLERYADEVVKELVPYKVKRNKDHGKNEGGGFLVDMGYDADGKEEELERLMDFKFEDANALHKKFFHYFHDDKEEVLLDYVEFKDDDDDPAIGVIVRNSASAKKLRFANFMDDVRKIEKKDHSELENIIANEKVALKHRFIEELDRIESDPNKNVVKLRKNSKFIIL